MSEAIEREAFATAQDPAVDLATRAAARASLQRPSDAEVLRRYGAAITAMPAAERDALRRALRALAGILDPWTLRVLGSACSGQAAPQAPVEPAAPDDDGTSAEG